MRYAQRVAGLGGPAAETWAIHTEAVRRRRRGEDVILLSVGDPDFPSPAPIIEAAKASLDKGRTHYADVVGQQPLREAIAAQHERLSGQRVTADEVVVFAGAQCALFAALQCLVEPGDEVIVLEPAYVTYPAPWRRAGPRSCPCRCGRATTSTSTRRTWRRRSRRAPAPSCGTRPTTRPGRSRHGPRSRRCARVARERDLWVVSDEVYATLVYEGEHLAPASLPGMAERTVTVSSVSKSHAMTGWRLGWLVGPPELALHAGNLTLCMLYGSPAFVQDAATVALTRDLPEVRDMAARYRRRRDAVTGRLSGLPGVSCHTPAGGMFVMLDVRPTGLTAEAFAFGLLDAEGVSVLPGDAFGSPAAGHVEDQPHAARGADRGRVRADRAVRAEVG